MINSQTILNFIQDNFPGYNQRGDEVNFNSPFSNDTKKRLYVNISSGRWFDQKEQRGSNSFVSFVSEYLSINYSDAEKVLESDYVAYTPNKMIDIRDIVSGAYKSENKFDNVVSVLDPLEVHPIMFDNIQDLDEDGELALEYLSKRKINHAGLGYFPKSDPLYSGRIFIPFYENGELVYFLARSYIGSELRYKNPPGVAGDAVFNYDKIQDSVVIFEGSFDAMALDNMVGTAILSNKLKEKQAEKLMGIDSLNTIIFVPDKDEKTSTRKTILTNLIANYNLLNKYKKMSKNIRFLIYNIPDGYKDFGEYKEKTGNGNINLDECKKYNETLIRMEIMNL